MMTLPNRDRAAFRCETRGGPLNLDVASRDSSHWGGGIGGVGPATPRRDYPGDSRRIRFDRSRRRYANRDLLPRIGVRFQSQAMRLGEGLTRQRGRRAPVWFVERKYTRAHDIQGPKSSCCKPAEEVAHALTLSI